MAVMPGSETAQEIVNLAATAEALAVTFYYQGVTAPGGFITRLPNDWQTDLRVALDQEHHHYHYLLDNGAIPGDTAFYFPANTFGFDDLVRFLATLDTLETAILGLYLAASRRFGELGDAVSAELMGQFVGIEAEHRVLGREIEQNSPPAPNNLCFEQAVVATVGQVANLLAPYMNGGDGMVGPFSLPTDTAVTAAVAGITCLPVSPAAAASCDESLNDILNIAATAEALGITFYYHGIQGSFFHQLPEPQQWYLQAALDEERHHYHFLASNGATPAATTFFFPSLSFDDLSTFLGILDTLENAFISAYLAAMQRFAQLEQPLLAEIAAQILGIEAEHRVLGRFIAGAVPAIELCLSRADFGCISEAATALEAFLTGNNNHILMATLPTEAEIDTAVDRFGCVPVPLATTPSFLYLPVLAKS
jgi:hypothetical protein